MFYFARCMNIIFDSLLAQLAKYYVHTTRKNKINTCNFLSHIIIDFNSIQCLTICFRIGVKIVKVTAGYVRSMRVVYHS